MLKSLLLLLLTMPILFGCQNVATRNESRPPAGLVSPRLFSARAVRVSDDSGHGTGFPFGRDVGRTLIATAKHVVDKVAADYIFTIEWYDGGRQSAPAWIWKVHETLDVAILQTTVELPLFGLSFEALAPKTTVMSIGYGRDIYPPLVTVGFIHVNGKNRIFHTSGIWFGFSGGPLLDAATGRVIGINTLIYGDRQGPLSNRASAVPVESLRVLLEETK